MLSRPEDIQLSYKDGIPRLTTNWASRISSRYPTHLSASNVKSLIAPSGFSDEWPYDLDDEEAKPPPDPTLSDTHAAWAPYMNALTNDQVELRARIAAVIKQVEQVGMPVISNSEDYTEEQREQLTKLYSSLYLLSEYTNCLTRAAESIAHISQGYFGWTPLMKSLQDSLKSGVVLPGPDEGKQQTSAKKEEDPQAESSTRVTTKSRRKGKNKKDKITTLKSQAESSVFGGRLTDRAIEELMTLSLTAQAIQDHMTITQVMERVQQIMLDQSSYGPKTVEDAMKWIEGGSTGDQKSTTGRNTGKRRRQKTSKATSKVDEETVSHPSEETTKEGSKGTAVPEDAEDTDTITDIDVKDSVNTPTQSSAENTKEHGGSIPAEEDPQAHSRWDEEYDSESQHNVENTAEEGEWQVPKKRTRRPVSKTNVSNYTTRGGQDPPTGGKKTLVSRPKNVVTTRSFASVSSPSPRSWREMKESEVPKIIDPGYERSEWDQFRSTQGGVEEFPSL
ncbi:hypothetical protein TREMEDRAFT_58858 [Tremella mesenterica DSM 1558]|uniref:uncharacterized protein n=1 Tax=Tremella mesenterica (strain ATCC 24925 / CBS 8224 / DSM 1558 / NBRC 9311 / NRRL Y-6157 / RJB 2259-6 / UBC 559-6) TaxID=578456 RepID=UPI0003F49572|nr:uncharacterized protein TREMEDRAFT_58858 [Tremella mesenterica DSM 1558]EIW72689.1 hypothetical protein TREMEDRAFT_58858 [Tremella mesenterica DSM 1558]